MFLRSGVARAVWTAQGDTLIGGWHPELFQYFFFLVEYVDGNEIGAW